MLIKFIKCLGVNSPFRFFFLIFLMVLFASGPTLYKITMHEKYKYTVMIQHDLGYRYYYTNHLVHIEPDVVLFYIYDHDDNYYVVREKDCIIKVNEKGTTNYATN